MRITTLNKLAERRMRQHRAGRFNFALSSMLTLTLTCGLVTASQAQDMPNDAQMEAAFGSLYNHLGLLEYCQSKGFASATDVTNMRAVVKSQTGGITVTPDARAKEGPGSQGMIIGPQVIRLLDASNPSRPEKVPAGQTVTLAANARAQKTTEQALCRLMAAQAAPLN